MPTSVASVHNLPWLCCPSHIIFVIISLIPGWLINISINKYLLSTFCGGHVLFVLPGKHVSSLRQLAFASALENLPSAALCALGPLPALAVGTWLRLANRCPLFLRLQGLVWWWTRNLKQPSRSEFHDFLFTFLGRESLFLLGLLIRCNISGLSLIFL